jgi:hypothetical protein
MPSFSLFLSRILGADSLVPPGPVNAKRLRSEPTEEPRVDPNASLPTLADQLARAQVAATTNLPPASTTEIDNAPQLANDATKSLNPRRPDKDLGDLKTRFSEDTGRFATDEEVRLLNSRLVIEDPKNGEEHVLFGGASELYLADRLRDLDHSFENASDLPDPRTNPLRTTHYPQGRDDFTNGLSVVRAGGKTYEDYFGEAKMYGSDKWEKFSSQ